MPRETQPGRPGRHPAQKPRGSAGMGLAIGLGVLVTALCLFFLTQKKVAKAEPKVEEPTGSPFADLPAETPPEKPARKGQR